MSSLDFSMLQNLTFNCFWKWDFQEQSSDTHSVELISPGEDQALPEMRTLLQKGTGKGKPAGSAAFNTGVQSHSLGELSCLGLAMNPLSAWVPAFSENQDCVRPLPSELLMKARLGGVSLCPTCPQHGRNQGGGSKGSGYQWGEVKAGLGQAAGESREQEADSDVVQDGSTSEHRGHCAGLVWEAACIQIGIYQERCRHEVASACILLSSQPHYEALATLKSKHRFTRIRHHLHPWYRLGP